jgi:hypothetical protein
LEHLGELAEGLLGRVADQQPAQHAPSHAEQALALEPERYLLDILQFRGRDAGEPRSPSRNRDD